MRDYPDQGACSHQAHQVKQWSRKISLPWSMMPGGEKSCKYNVGLEIAFVEYSNRNSKGGQQIKHGITDHEEARR
jgi:hypothetical protein